MSSEEPRAAPPEPGRASFLRRWGPVALAAAVLAVLSQVAWLWQSWPVRQLISSMNP